MNWGEAIRRLGSLERQKAEYLARARRRPPTHMEHAAVAGLEQEIAHIRTEISQRFTSSRLMDIAKQGDPHLRTNIADTPAASPATGTPRGRHES